MNNRDPNTRNENQTNQNNDRTEGSSMPNWDNLMFSVTPNSTTSFTSSGNSRIAAIAGGWMEAVGTIIAAIGNTPSSIFSQSTLNGFRLVGNTLQASGGALVAENQDLLLDVVGDLIQAAGNITVIASILDENEQSSQVLGTQGNLLQILGAGISLNLQPNLSFPEVMDNIGNIIQVIGNTIQVFSNTDTEEGVTMNAVGSWVQAVGAVISAIAGDYEY